MAVPDFDEDYLGWRVKEGGFVGYTRKGCLVEIVEYTDINIRFN